MQSRLLILPLLASLAALGACQGDNPYRASSLPYPPQPATAANPGLDPGAYPAAPRDYARYRSWSWAAAGVSGFPQGLDDNQLRDAVSQQLDQRGLRPARPGSAADLQVSAFLRNELRTRQVTDYYGGYYGNYGGWRDPWYGYGASYPVTRSYTVQVTVVRVELNDARSGQPVWGS
uniref:DUF4136 domain-containing protein n=1 Tax=Pseudomonas aeruginosa TaxID=287 RepID=UPI0013C40B1F